MRPIRGDLILGLSVLGILLLYYAWVFISAPAGNELAPCPDSSSKYLEFTITGLDGQLPGQSGEELSLSAENISWQATGDQLFNGLILESTKPLREAFQSCLEFRQSFRSLEKTISDSPGKGTEKNNQDLFEAEKRFSEFQLSTSDLAMSAGKASIKKGRIGPFYTNLYQEIDIRHLTLDKKDSPGWKIEGEKAHLFFPISNLTLENGIFHRKKSRPEHFSRCTVALQEGRPVITELKLKPPQEKPAARGPLGLKSRLFK